MERRKNPYNDKSSYWLRKHQVMIEEALKFRGGQSSQEFEKIHVLPECKVKPIVVRVEGSGFYDTDLYEAPYFYYAIECAFHGVRSSEFGDFKRLEGATFAPELQERIDEYIRSKYH